MKRFKILAAASVVIGAQSAAQNAPKAIARGDYVKTIDGRFNLMDTNHDGSVSKSELAAQAQRDLEAARARINQQLAASFNRLDTNHDGKLSLQEFQGAAPSIKAGETPDQLMARLDANHDGKITADEFRGPELAKFNKVDANHDGIVTPQEVQAARGK